jgi:hypothetical protein
MMKIKLQALVFAVLSITGVSAFAAGAGQVQQLSGTLTVQRPDGTVRILSQKSEVNPGVRTPRSRSKPSSSAKPSRRMTTRSSVY